MAKYPGTLLPRLTDPKDSRESRKAVLDLLKKINDTNTTFDSDIETLTDATSYSIANGRNFKNTIINGDLQIWQRGTSFAAAVSGSYSADRWLWVNTSAGVVTISQSTDTPDTSSLWSLQVDVTTADASLAAGDVAYIQYSAEGYDARKYIGNAFTLSFYVKSPKSGIHCVSFRNSINDRSYVAEYTVNAPNTWEKKTITVDGGLITTGTWVWTNGLGVSVNFTLAAGTTFQTTSNGWQTGNFFATSNQVNCLDSTANNFFISQVQLELGDVATDFERKPIGTVVQQCQRYYRKSYNLTVAPGTNTGAGAVFVTISTYSTNNAYITINCTGMRIAPTVSVWRTNGTASLWDYERSGASGTCSQLAATSDNSTDNARLVFGSIGAAWTNCIIFGHYALDAEF